VISAAKTNGISTVAHSRSLAAKAMMYRLVSDRSLGLLYTAKQSRTFPMTLVMFIARQILASTTAATKLRVGNSSEDILALNFYKITLSCLLLHVKKLNDYLKLG